MSVTISPEAGDLITVRVSGKLGPAHWMMVQQDVAKRLSSSRRTSFLVIVESFEGWEQGDWDDMSFQLEHDSHIGRMAIVAEPKWKDEALLFAGKGFRKFDIQFFPDTRIADARAWLASST
jgi:hypothetical protein